MIDIVPLPPHLEQFICDQIASGRYSSEGDVIRAALQQLKGSSLGDARSAGPPPLTPPARSRPPGQAAFTGRWELPREWLAALPARDAPPPAARRSPRGILADLRSDLDPDDFRAARREMWAGLRHGGVG